MVSPQFLLAIIVITLILMYAIVMAIVLKSTKKASPDEAFVVTGMGGCVVVKDGFKFIFPKIHHFTPVSLKVVKFDIQLEKRDAILTGDNISLDIYVDIYIRVSSDPAAIKTAAQTLGEDGIKPENLKNLIEPKLISGLGVIAATKTYEEIHTCREDFISQVKNYIDAEIGKNGLIVETIAITRLRQV